MKTIYIVILTFLIGEPTFAQQTITLETAKEMALEKNNQLRIAQENIAAARAARTGSKALLYPNISVSTTGFYFGKPISDLIPEYGAAATLGVNHAIYSGGKIKLGIETAQNDIAIQETQKAVSTTEVLLNVEKSYWQIVNRSKKLDLISNYKTLLQVLLKDLNNALAAGSIYKNDVLRAQVQLNTANLNSLKAEDGLAMAKLSFAQLIGLNEQEPFNIDDHTNDSSLETRENLANASDKRPEIDLLEKIIEQQKLQVNLLKADYKPTVGINVNGVNSFGKEGINFSNPNSHSLTSYYGLLSISIPVWDGGATRQKIKAQTFMVSAQEIQLEDTKQLLSLEVKQAKFRVNEAAKGIELFTISLAQAEENLRLTNDRFKAGTILSKDVLEAQNIWEKANTDVIDAKIQYKISEAELKKALGILK